MFRDFISGKKNVDLHIHTKLSDGTHSVQEILEMAFQHKLKAVSITDHDCINAYPFAQQRGSELGIEVIPGVELSSEIDGVDIHILGYYLDIHNPLLTDTLSEMKRARYLRAEKIVENLNSQGIDLRFETVLNIAGDAAIGRPHIAAALLKEELVYSFREAFDKYIGYESPAYVKKFTILPKDVFQLIRQAGGIPVLAHPGVTSVDKLLPQFIQDGLMGIEVFHSEHSEEAERFYLQYSKKNNLAFTGGSDFHNSNQNKGEIGHPKISYAAVESLKEKLGQISQQTLPL
ncbi:MAG TPA: PHP domain-containing protein [Chitinivibrionales bacterium]